MITTFSDLCEKQVINCTDGSNFGNVSNMEISADDCRITAIFVSYRQGLFSKPEEIRIPWENIEKIGCDVIIVKCAPICGKCEFPPKENKRYFLYKKN